MNFNAFHFHPNVAAGIKAAGFVEPTPIQAQAIPSIMEGLDVMGTAQTGTGKTAAFVLPLLNRLIGKKRGRIRALIIAPTRELAEQIHQDICTLGRRSRLRSATVYGGVGFDQQVRKLKGGAEIIVACPGRLLDHMNRGHVDFASVEALVLDEADQMFDMGFFPDIRKILQQIPRKRQTLLFSATMPAEIKRLAREVLHQPVTIQVGNPAPADTVSHALYPVNQHAKTSLLLKLLRQTQIRSALVFTRTKHRAKHLGEKLSKAGFRSTSLQGNLSQSRRQAALAGFRSGKFQILVATDIAARGIDVSRVSHVINYDIPATAEAYIHRVGRTGRAKRRGEALTLVTNEDKVLFRAIKPIVGSNMDQRVLPDFDYGSPDASAPSPSVSSKRPWKKRYKASGMPMRRNNKSLQLKNPI
ncbi:MAG: DEAD/DEAH box helicase [Desulfobacteraceae bacterium]|nr:DEAD/DEAH box helicase [Desulfobacteraceae bacterium]